jgi:hypothetical protein
MPKPFEIKNLAGEPHCCVSCSHLDCAETRKLIGRFCKCRKPMNRGDSYNYYPDGSVGHHPCVMDDFFGVRAVAAQGDG